MTFVSSMNLRRNDLSASVPYYCIVCQTMTNFVNTLSPDHGQRAGENITVSAVSPPLFTIEELQGAAHSLKSNKAPRSDVVPTEVLRFIAEERRRVLLDMYNACLTRDVFPIR